MMVVERRGIMNFVRWKLLPVPNHVFLVVLPVSITFLHCLGHGQLQIVSRIVRAAWVHERHFINLPLHAEHSFAGPARFAALVW